MITAEPLLTAAELKALITLQEATRHLRGSPRRARDGQPPSLHPPALGTVRRWANPAAGYPLKGGGRVVLKTVRMGHWVLTTPAWCEAFDMARIRPAPRPQPLQARPRRTRDAAGRRADAFLDRHGAR